VGPSRPGVPSPLWWPGDSPRPLARAPASPPPSCIPSPKRRGLKSDAGESGGLPPVGTRKGASPALVAGSLVEARLAETMGDASAVAVAASQSLCPTLGAVGEGSVATSGSVAAVGFGNFPILAALALDVVVSTVAVRARDAAASLAGVAGVGERSVALCAGPRLSPPPVLDADDAEAWHAAALAICIWPSTAFDALAQPGGCAAARAVVTVVRVAAAEGAGGGVLIAPVHVAGACNGLISAADGTRGSGWCCPRGGDDQGSKGGTIVGGGDQSSEGRTGGGDGRSSWCGAGGGHDDMPWRCMRPGLSTSKLAARAERGDASAVPTAVEGKFDGWFLVRRGVVDSIGVGARLQEGGPPRPFRRGGNL
jgi:hypothetical protein